MKENDSYHKEISHIYRNIQYNQQLMALSTEIYQRMFYENLIKEQMRRLYYWQYYYEHPEQREFTLEELAKYDGSGGRPAYVAVGGTVYDVSLEDAWGGGTHFSLYAGRDLTDQFNRCHRGQLEVLRNLPKAGTLIG